VLRLGLSLQEGVRFDFFISSQGHQFLSVVNDDSTILKRQQFDFSQFA
jgi:hypothetical protein